MATKKILLSDKFPSPKNPQGFSRKEEYLLRLSILEQEAGKLQEQLQIINQQILELGALKMSIGKLKGEREVLAPLGKGIYFKADVKEEKLFVNVGSGIVLKKTPEDTEKIIDDQIEQLKEVKRSIVKSIEEINFELQNLLIEAQKENKE